MLKNVIRKCASLFLAIIMVVSLLPAMTLSAAAAEVPNVSGLEYSGGTYASNVLTGTVTSTGYSKGTCSETLAAAKSTEITLTNKSGADAQLTFDYNVTAVGNTSAYVEISVGGQTTKLTTKGAKGQISEKLPAGQTVKITVHSGNPTDSNDKATYTTTVELSNFSLVKDTNVTMKFKPAEQGGSYTVTAGEVSREVTTEEYVNTQNATIAYNLVAKPQTGYKFMGWYSVADGAYLSDAMNWELRTDKDAELTAVFCSAESPIFEVTDNSGHWFADLNEAISYANSKNQTKITLIKDGTLPAGDYTIPSGKTLLIPMDDAHTLSKDNPICVVKGKTDLGTPTAYRTLNLGESAKLIVNGTLCVNSKIAVEGQTDGWNGAPCGQGGRIVMGRGSEIQLKGGTLYAWGYITGKEGKITAENNSTVWECFQTTSWRGGSHTSGSLEQYKNNKIFPMNQYYIQQIEAPLELQYGATEKIFAAVNMSNSAWTGSGTLVGADGLFQIDEGGSLTKYYDSENDRLVLRINGAARTANMKIKIYVEIDSQSYVLPINNMSIEICDGANLTITKDVSLLPDSSITIDEGGSLTVNENVSVYVYDKAQWVAGNYAAGAKVRPVRYSVEKGTEVTKIRVENAEKSTMKDATIDVNGTLTVKGQLYTAGSGANIISSGSKGTGKIILESDVRLGEIKENNAAAKMDVVTIPVTSANLKNADGSDTKTTGAKAGDTYAYNANDGVWHVYMKQEEKAATCTEDGNPEYYTCKVDGCEKLFDNEYQLTTAEALVIPAKGHTPGEAKQENVVNATCTDEGSYDLVVRCTVCNEVITSEPKTNEPLGHDWSDWQTVTAATCVAAGSEKRTCQREGCTGEETREIAINPDNHANVVTDAAKAPTCTETGLTAGSHCEACEKTIVAQETVDALGHDMQEVAGSAKAPTCTAEGKEADKACSRCDHTETGKSIEKLPHTWDEGEVTTQPTCTTEGVKTFTCTVCGTIKTEAVAIDADAHAWGAWKNSGFGHGHHIRVCEHNKEHIDFEDHTWDEGKITTDPTCTDEGEMTFTCTVCEATRTEEVAALGHDIKGSVAHKDASCTEDGVEGGTYCTRCNDGKAAAEAAISKLGHNAEGTVDHKDASCTEDGVVGGTYCTRCNDGKAAAEAKIDATGHTEVTDKAVEPTCTETGLTAGKHCSVCDTVLVAREVVNAKGHTEVTDAAVAATCTATGLTEGKHCSVCNTVLEEQTVTEKIAHTHGAAVRENEVDSTCTAEGSYDEVVYCTVCKTELSREGKTITKKAHTSGEAKQENVKDATCTVAGSYDLVVRCTVCGEKLSSEAKTIPATGHAMRETEAQINATCETAGKTAVLTCANGCGKTEGGAEIPATGHAMQETEAQIDATCETAGKTAVLTCANGCGKTEGGAEIPATGHAMQETEARIDATCETAGKTAVLTCANGCGKTEGGEMVDALGHNWIAGDITENATCEGAGVQKYTCDRCDKTEDRTISATGHEAVTVPGTPATCTTTGTTDGDWCSKCEAWITGHQEIPATGHTEVIDEAQAPTCTETGLTEGKHCSVCNEVLTAQETVEALGHEIVTDEAVEATCTESGLTEGSHCTRCDDATVEQEEIPATGHTEVIDAAVEPTYDAPGKTEGKHCEVCGTVLVPQETLPQLTRPVTPDPGPSTPVTPVTPVPPTPVEPVTPAPVEPTPEEPTETGETEPGEEEDLTEVETPLGETPVELGGGLLQLPVIGAGNVVIREDGSIVTKSLVEEQRAYLLLSEPATVRIVSNVKRFIDVKADDWFAPAVDFVSSHELFNGVSDNEFAPDVTMDRAMMVTVLWRLEGCPQVEGTVTFADVAEGEWYTQAVLWAARMGIVKGYDDGNFGTWDKVTREQIAAILYRYMNVMGMNTDAAAKLSAYRDSGEVSDWAQDAMTWAVSRGIITGVTGTLLAPQDDAARCQVATMLQRLVTDMVK